MRKKTNTKENKENDINKRKVMRIISAEKDSLHSEIKYTTENHKQKVTPNKNRQKIGPLKRLPSPSPNHHQQ